MKQIQWFPGHMAKAIKEINEIINSVDLVIELVDARCPLSSSNPLMNEIISRKPVLKLMSKADLANPLITKKWIEYFKQNNIASLATSIDKFNVKELKDKCLNLAKDKIAKNEAKGIKNTIIKAMVVGIPNVGKSTLINKLSKKNSAKAENKPGVTKTRQYIKIDEKLILMDTPGILWPSFEDKTVGYNLALIGSIKQDILPNDDICFYLLKLLSSSYPSLLKSNFNIVELINNDDKLCLKAIEKICDDRKFYLQNSRYDYDRCIIHILREFANGKIGNISLEEPIDGE